MNNVFQFSSKQGSTSSALPKDQGNGTSGDQTGSNPADTTVPEDITNFYDKMDKEDEDEEEEAVLKTVSFEVNQVTCCTIVSACFTYCCL
jgi:DNA excision repair protein ERCC-3